MGPIILFRSHVRVKNKVLFVKFSLAEHRYSGCWLLTRTVTKERSSFFCPSFSNTGAHFSQNAHTPLLPPSLLPSPFLCPWIAYHKLLYGSMFHSKSGRKGTLIEVWLFFQRCRSLCHTQTSTHRHTMHMCYWHTANSTFECIIWYITTYEPLIKSKGRKKNTLAGDDDEHL